MREVGTGEYFDEDGNVASGDYWEFDDEFAGYRIDRIGYRRSPDGKSSKPTGRIGDIFRHGCFIADPNTTGRSGRRRFPERVSGTARPTCDRSDGTGNSQGQ